MKTLFTHAVVALDHSQASDIILDQLQYLKELGLKKVTLITVVSVAYTDDEGEVETDLTPYEDKLENYKKRMENAGLAAEIEIKSGSYAFPPTEIMKTADEKNADFIIIGNRGHSMVQEMLLGSTATEVLQRSHLPVLLLNMDIEYVDEDETERHLVVHHSFENVLSHVLHATDFSDTADRAFEVVQDLDAKSNVGKVSLIHVQGHHALALSDPISHDELMKMNEENLEEMRNTLSDNTREDSEIIITFGTPGKEIIQAIEERGITLAVLGSQGKGFVHEFFLGGVSTQVTRFSKIPVLLIPAEREQ
ncbi:MAG: universal stress protein [Bacteroidetes bacterium]|jgi:nucleotide-binding universal stress UspA family protein|nr:universal stress protein [Bacteroidota bacterium]